MAAWNEVFRGPQKKFKCYPIGYFHIDIAEMRTAEGKLYLFVAIDRTSKFAYAERHEKTSKMVAAQFLRNLVTGLPYAIHTVLTDNGIQFTNRRQDRYAFSSTSLPASVAKTPLSTASRR